MFFDTLLIKLSQALKLLVIANLFEAYDYNWPIGVFFLGVAIVVA